ncbi:MAG TPA: membrane protein insertase YidC, partial [Telluria sp.]|nr:membrane protein insertase YidC [Telluria sp.]
MEINKRTILWIVFAVSLVVLWNDWMVSNGKQSMFSATPPASTATAPAAKPANSDVPTLAAQAPSTGVPGQPGAAPAAAPVQAERITITTDVVKADIDTAGGVIK